MPSKPSRSHRPLWPDKGPFTLWFSWGTGRDTERSTVVPSSASLAVLGSYWFHNGEYVDYATEKNHSSRNTASKFIFVLAYMIDLFVTPRSQMLSRKFCSSDGQPKTSHPCRGWTRRPAIQSASNNRRNRAMCLAAFLQHANTYPTPSHNVNTHTHRQRQPRTHTSRRVPIQHVNRCQRLS